MLKSADARIVTEALEELSVEYREVIVLREFKDLSYKEIARRRAGRDRDVASGSRAII
jgi:DNA-directed RNA polymerase specialized sigma24 family protein